MPVKANAAGVWRKTHRPGVKRAFEIGATLKTANINRVASATARPRFRAGAASKPPEHADFLEHIPIKLNRDALWIS
jgi:hypothetical protein